jgi:hypothetical protein
MMPPVVSLGGAGGSSVPFFLTGTRSAKGIINPAAQAGNYTPDETDPDGTFMICIETAAAIEVKLADGHDFTITLAQATAYLGTWYPAKLLLVYKTGSTGTFSVGR